MKELHHFGTDASVTFCGMADSDPAIPVLPVLEYANPKGGSPLKGRLKIEYQEDCLVITDPRAAGTSPALLRGLGVVLIVLGTVLSISCAGPLLWGGSCDWEHLLLALAAVVCGSIAFLRSSPADQQGTIVRLACGRLHTKDSPEHDWLSGRFVPRRFVANITSTGLKGLTSRYSVRVRYRFKIAFELISSLSHDEAIWAVDLLEKALRNENKKSKTDAGV